MCLLTLYVVELGELENKSIFLFSQHGVDFRNKNAVIVLFYQSGSKIDFHQKILACGKD